MIIIDKIEIKSFRSFGNRKIGKVTIEKLNHLNIFSGANDSGKSNILRALNLFFNKTTDLNTFFDFNTDFYKKNTYCDNDVQEKVVTIKIYFNNQENLNKNKQFINKIYLPEKFWVSRKYFQTSEYSSYAQDDGIISSFKLEKGMSYAIFCDSVDQLKSTVKASLKKQLTQYLDSIQYHYIPAIKDKNYFSHLYGELQQTLWKEEKSNVIENKNSFQQSIQSTTSDLMSEFEKMANYSDLSSPVFELPTNLIDIFKSLDVNTGIVKLSYRGDGIQAKLIPEILSFIAKKEKNMKSKETRTGEKKKKYFIWGFEEPENSYEYKNAQLLADKMKTIFSEDIQILLTTHSFNFTSLEGTTVSTYRVFKDPTLMATNIQQVKKLSSQNILEEELGVLLLNNQLKLLYDQMEKQKNFLLEQEQIITKKLEEASAPLIITEGKTDWKHIKKALEKFHLHGEFTNVNVQFLEYENEIEMGDSSLNYMCDAFSKIKQQQKTIFIFDRDQKEIRKKHTDDEYIHHHSNNVYSFCIPKINNEKDWISIEFYYEDADIKTYDNRGKRLFIGNEFFPKSGFSTCGKFCVQDKNKAGNLAIIDTAVFSIEDKEWKNPVTLSKNDFANNIYNDKENFDNFTIENFRLIFNILEKIILEETL